MLLFTKLDLSKKVFDKVQGVEYDEIFSLVSMLKSVRIMLAIAAFYDYENLANGCQNCILEWISGRRVVYDATRRFC